MFNHLVAGSLAAAQQREQEGTMAYHAENIVALQQSNIRMAAAVAARAFENDLMFIYIFPNRSKRFILLDRFMRAAMRYGTLYGEVHTTSDGAGTAVWLTPEQPDITPGRMIRSGMAALPITLGLGAFRRFLAFTSYGERVHAAVANEPHWYLLNLAVDPAFQRQGIGTKLIAPVLARADVNGQLCYLESNNPDNLPFYAKQGFEIAHAGQVPNNGPLFWGLVRKPQNSY